MGSRDNSEQRVSVCVRLTPDRVMLCRQEAMRRLERGEAQRYDFSRVVRDALDRFLRPDGGQRQEG